MNRLMTNICSDNLIKSRDFYSKIFKLNIAFECDWFIHLVADNKNLELGIIDRTNEIVPEEFQNKPQGFYITFVVDNADEIFNIAVAESFEIVQEPADTFYGQRRVLLKDPDGTLIDVSSPIKNFSF